MDHDSDTAKSELNKEQNSVVDSLQNQRDYIRREFDSVRQIMTIETAAAEASANNLARTTSSF